MDTITLNEALIVMLVEQDGVDATNAIPLLRHAQAVIVDAAGGRAEALHTERTTDDADSIIIALTMNGRFDIFRDDL